ncbi:uncharacterized protein F5Z01DRAFT_314388 [Emericellopsis atlantica]|uniref:Uncharacterized protein n=1 Tax=Emericellopsis atlantica TaxID=2614577 RepID=A0A9P7ZUR2_9HYPO|nr:uncharacterized protein F5Z01DRAFT_314388 [Emericellopsis atlantica]KAG9258018.1 hypothetical protein F5Z01DRAFT_314388 [Emericellopsis atlantica]
MIMAPRLGPRQVEDNDPFLWDVEQVVAELCGANCPWAKDPAAFADRLRAEELDGRTLLTYQSTTSLDRLLNRLSFQTLRDESRFNEKVNDLRLQSPSFVAWRFALDRKQERVSGIIASEEDGNIEEDRLSYVPEEAPYPRSQDARINGIVSSPATPALGQVPILGGSQSSAVERRLSTPFELKRPATHGDDSATDAAEPPPKKSRVQPTNISLQTVTEHIVALPWEHAPTWAYIGDGALTQEMLTSDSEPVTSLVLDYVDKVSSEEEFTVKPKWMPPGRRMAVAMVMRRLLIKNARNLVRIDDGEEVISEFGIDKEDRILALSDLPSELDDDTRQEIEDERLEAEELRLQEDGIPQHKVQEILDEEIEAFTRLWKTRKASRLKREAWSLWNQARKGKRNIMSEQSRTEIRALDERIATYTGRILRERWQVESEVRAQAQILEASVEDRLYQAWKLNVLECRVEPERPLKPARPSLTPKKRPAAMEEVLTSSDEEDDTDFIVHDEDPLPMDISDAAADSSNDAANDAASGQTRHAPEAANGDGDAAQGSDGETSQSLKANPTTPVRTRHPQSPKVPPSQHSVTVIDLTLEPDSQPTEASTTDAVNGPSLKSLGSLSPITAHDAKFWSNQNDRWRLVLWVMANMTFNRRKAVFVALQTYSPLNVWKMYVTVFLNEPPQDYGMVGTWTENELLCFDIARLFLTHLRCRVQAEKRLVPPTKKTIHKIRSNNEGFSLFCRWLREKESIFPTADQIYRGHDPDNIPDSDEEIPADKELEEYGSPQKRRKQTKEVVQNRDALTLRQVAKERIKEQETRRQKLRAQLAGLGSLVHGDNRIIINESKDEEQELVYVDKDISRSIKEHQIDGVRFLWNQIVLPPMLRQGCLLAHTMGLGKTMQVITFLVALAQASSDAKTATQIPEDLRKSKTLILCPAGLVNNWMDELCKWAPKDSLGPLVSLDSAATSFMREDIIREWAADGGVLVLGYDMFKAFFRKDKSDDEGRLQYEELAALLLETPRIVVADEAHKLKTQSGVLNSLCSQFYTSGRIALTGSPLSNNTIEYYSMIHWVAPNFLGPLEEFKDIYVREIEDGLARDSLAVDKKRALRKLHALKTTVAPKVHRATIKVLSHDLPPKSEFVISVPPTKLQCDLYTLYINAIHDGGVGRQGSALTAARDLVLLCNHPACFGYKVMQEIATGTDNKASTFPAGIINEANRLTNSNPTIQDPSYSAKVLYLCRILDVSRAVGDKVLVFSQSIPTLDYLQKIMEMQDRRFCRLDGGSKINERQHQTRAFNDGQQDVYLISTRAGGVGLNIQGANRVVIFDSQWNPADDQQAVGRAYRLGQLKHVFVYYLMVAGTIEQELHNQAVFKGQLATRVVDQKNPISWGQRHGKYLMHIQHPKDGARTPNLAAFKGKDQILDDLIQNPPRTVWPEPQQLQIRKLVSTDTFEEEDIDATLTLEERKEAEEAVRLDRLRRTDPTEHAKLVAEQQAHQAQQWQHPIHAVSTPNGGNMTSIPPPTQPHGTTRPPHHIPDLNGPTTMAPSIGAASADGQRREPALQESNSGVPDRSSGADDAAPAVAIPNVPPPPMPMVGANTYFGRQTEVMSSTHSPGPATSASAATDQPPPTSPMGMPAPAFTFNSSQSQPLDATFQQKLIERLEAIPGVTRHSVITLAHGGIQHRAISLARSIQQVLEARGAGFLPDKVQWKLLTELLDNERFTIALAYGLLTPNYVASAGRKVLRSRVDSLERLSPETFMAQCSLKTQNKDPVELQRHSTSGASSSRARKEDSAVLAEMSKSRQTQAMAIDDCPPGRTHH